MWTEALAPAAMSPKEQTRVWLGALPLIWQVPGPEYVGLIVQLTPEPLGSGSLSVTAVAVPVPAAELLLTVMVKPIDWPASTGLLSAVLTMPRPGHWTVVLADFLSSGWFLAST